MGLIDSCLLQVRSSAEIAPFSYNKHWPVLYCQEQQVPLPEMGFMV